jgi:hypothetical protein
VPSSQGAHAHLLLFCFCILASLSTTTDIELQPWQLPVERLLQQLQQLLVACIKDPSRQPASGCWRPLLLECVLDAFAAGLFCDGSADCCCVGGLCDASRVAEVCLNTIVPRPACMASADQGATATHQPAAVTWLQEHAYHSLGLCAVAAAVRLQQHHLQIQCHQR